VTTARSDNTDPQGRGDLFTTLTAIHKSVQHGASSDELDLSKPGKAMVCSRDERSVSRHRVWNMHTTESMLLSCLEGGNGMFIGNNEQ
jgi:hypothetical protein